MDIRALIVLVITLLNSLAAAQSSAPLSGTYTVDPSIPSTTTNYHTIDSIFTDLITYGVSGPVVINLADTSFNEQLYLHNVPGVSAANNIIIQGDPQSPKYPRVYFSATSNSTNYVIKLDSISHITLNRLKIEATGQIYGRVLHIAGATKHIKIENDSIVTAPYANISTVDCISTENANQYSYQVPANDSLIIKNNVISGGHAGISVGGYFYDGSGYIRIEDNLIENFYEVGLYINRCGNSLVSNNVIEISSLSSNRVYGLSGACGNSEFSNNIVKGNASKYLYSMTVNGNRVKILNNKIYTYSQNYNSGLDVNCTGNGFAYSSNSVIANNEISSKADSSVNGLKVDCDFTTIINNTVAIFGNAQASRAFWFGSNSGSYNSIYNNSFSNFARGYSIYIDDNLSDIDSMNYNNLFTNGVYLGYTKWGNVGNYFKHKTLDSWNARSGFDNKSISSNPVHVSEADLHATGLALNNKGKPHSFVSNDIDHQARSTTTPDIGADEFTPLNCQPPIHLRVTSEDKFSDSLFFYWTDGLSSSYDIEYGQAYFPLGSGTRQTGLTDTTFDLGNLIANTSYGFYIKSHCSSQDSSFWSGPYYFTTECSFSAPFIEEFSDIEIPGCWSTFNTTGNTSAEAFWKLTNVAWPLYGAQGVVNNTLGGGYAVGVDGSSTLPEDTSIILESPFIDISDLWKPTLKFDMFLNNIDTNHNQTLYLDVRQGSKWYKDVYSSNSNNANWVTHNFDLANYLFDDSIIKVRFRVDKTTADVPFYSDIIIDNIRVEDLSCSTPDSIESTALGPDSVMLKWRSSNSNAFSIIEYGPSGFSLGTGTTLVVQSPVKIGGLNPIQYDVYVRDTCGQDTTPYVGPVTFYPDTSSIGLFHFNTDSRLLLVYPNPVSDFLTIQGLKYHSNNVQIEILDLSGRIVRTTNLKKGKTEEKITIDLTMLPSGVYFLKATSNKDTSETRFIKQ